MKEEQKQEKELLVIPLHSSALEQYIVSTTEDSQFLNNPGGCINVCCMSIFMMSRLFVTGGKRRLST